MKKPETQDEFETFLREAASTSFSSLLDAFDIKDRVVAIRTAAALLLNVDLPPNALRERAAELAQGRTMGQSIYVQTGGWMVRLVLPDSLTRHSELRFEVLTDQLTANMVWFLMSRLPLFAHSTKQQIEKAGVAFTTPLYPRILDKNSS